MAAKRALEEHIAVFGGSGSGKTVLLSSFYGAAQEPAAQKESLFRITADNTGQGNRLRQNYLGMKNRSEVPAATRFASATYAFTARLKDQNDKKAAQSQKYDSLKLVWHDYPGEWFEEEPSSDEETQRRLETFRRLLRADVALILVDGQKLLDYQGEEEKYLRALFGSFCDGILRLKDDLLDEGQPLAEFPRIWIIALSKADLHPNMDVQEFKDLIIEKSAREIEQFEEILKELIALPDALSIGEDYLLLSSAKFEPGKIEVNERVGVDLLLPIAFILPLERLVQWRERLDIPRKMLDLLVDNYTDLSRSLRAVTKLLDGVGKFGKLLASNKVSAALDALPTLGIWLDETGPKIKEANAKARATQQYLQAVLSQFKIDIDDGVDNNLFIKSLR